MHIGDPTHNGFITHAHGGLVWVYLYMEGYVGVFFKGEVH